MKLTTANVASLPQRAAQPGATASSVEPKSQQNFDARQTRPIRLTPRELEVLALLCEGLPNKLISRRLGISAATVKCHISRILTELGVSSRLQAVVAASRYGLLADYRASSSPMDDRAASAAASMRLAGGPGFIAVAA